MIPTTTNEKCSEKYYVLYMHSSLANLYRLCMVSPLDSESGNCTSGIETALWLLFYVPPSEKKMKIEGS